VASLVRFRTIALSAIAVLLVLTAPAAGKPTAGLDGGSSSKKGNAVFFAADGLRQDIVQRYADKGLMPTMSKFLRKGISATGNGLPGASSDSPSPSSSPPPGCPSPSRTAPRPGARRASPRRSSRA
jgi:hypothetical protein